MLYEINAKLKARMYDITIHNYSLQITETYLWHFFFELWVKKEKDEMKWRANRTKQQHMKQSRIRANVTILKPKQIK